MYKLISRACIALTCCLLLAPAADAGRRRPGGGTGDGTESGGSSKSQPSAKATGVYGEVAAIPNDGEFHQIFSNGIHTSQQKDLFIQVNLECGLTTETCVAGQLGETSSSSSNAAVRVRVVVDPGTPDERLAFPDDENGVIFCRRTQTMSAIFGGVIEQCVDEDQDGEIVISEDCDVSDEEMNLVLDTMQANSFGYILDELGSGVHEVAVEAMIEWGNDTDSDCASAPDSAEAYLGKGSMTVEEVRMIKGEDIEF